MLLGIDTGGTFTDFVLLTEQGLQVHKVLSTPHAPEEAILQGIRELGFTDCQKLIIVHGSTVATNAVLEGKGARTVYITNRGLADVLSIGRQARQSLYDLQPSIPTPPVAANLCIETGGRISADGKTIEALTDADLQAIKESLVELKPQAVAINLLFSFLDDTAEKAIEKIIPEGVFISRSSLVLPEYKEYERGMTTWLNASVGPLVQGYLQCLKDGVAPASVSVMQSSGSTIAAEQAGELAVHLLLSGPAGGLAGAQSVARMVGKEKLLTFDMGGTSTDVALIDGEISLTSQGKIAGYPVAVPMVDMHTIGAGGGSLARVDAGGLLQVGPESAGASPGPACYGKGGKQATVTDANLVLGRLRVDAFLGGEMRLDEQAARQAVGKIADEMGVSVEEAAEGIIKIANEHMARALRVISVQRGIDPRQCSLTSFGGAGGLHVCALADALSMREALVPVHGGVLSALGMLAAPRGREYARSVNTPLADMNVGDINEHIALMLKQGQQALNEEGVGNDELLIEPSLDLCYQGQSSSLMVAWENIDEAIEQFHLAHQKRYGHRLELAVELVTIRLCLRQKSVALDFSVSSVENKQGEAIYINVYGMKKEVPVYQREQLIESQVLDGPALVTEKISTTWLAEGWQARLHGSGNLLLQRID
ncbi:MAG: hydantoinase/oxoprolinase family protein [Sulfuriflexus sp.]|nr:hydantoinase/oxoprolinase family protein [Sulfuriflexus sp.]